MSEICTSHGLAILVTHVNDGEPCSDYLLPDKHITARQLIVELTAALDGLKQRTLSTGQPCFCVRHDEPEPHYFENTGAATGHDNGFRHDSKCRTACTALANAAGKDGGR